MEKVKSEKRLKPWRLEGVPDNDLGLEPWIFDWKVIARKKRRKSCLNAFKCYSLNRKLLCDRNSLQSLSPMQDFLSMFWASDWLFIGLECHPASINKKPHLSCLSWLTVFAITHANYILNFENPSDGSLKDREEWFTVTRSAAHCINNNRMNSDLKFWNKLGEWTWNSLKNREDLESSWRSRRKRFNKNY